MLRISNFSLFLQKLINHNLLITNSKQFHSIHHVKHKKFIKKPPKNSINPKKKEKLPKPYMRDTIQKISKILRNSTWDSAQQELQTLQIQWDSYTINQVLKSHPPMEKAWLFFNWSTTLKGFKHDQFTYTTMLDIFGEAGRISSMKYVLKQMQEKGVVVDVVTYTSVLHWLSKDGDFDGAVKIWEDMRENGCCPSVVTYTAYMKVLFDNKRDKEAVKVYKEMIESGCVPNCFTYTVLMEHLASIGKFGEALQILSKMQEAGVQPDKATCNILVQKCSVAGEIWAMNHILQFMKEKSFVLRHPVYLEALEAFKKAGESVELLKEANPHLSFEGIDVEETYVCEATGVWTALDRAIMMHFLRRRNLIAVEHMLNVLINEKVVLDSTLISSIIQENCVNHRLASALSAFNYGLEMGITIERPACLSLVGIFIRSNSFPELVELVEKMIEAGVSLGTYLLSLVIYKLGGIGMPASSERIFNLLPDIEKNTVTYTALMGAFFGSRKVDKGLEIFDTMTRKGIRASSGTYSLLILGLKEAGRVREAEKYYKEKKCVLRYAVIQETVSMEDHLCDLIFSDAAAAL